MGHDFLTCYIKTDKLNDTMQDLMMPQIPPFNPDLYRFEFNFFKEQFINIDEASHRLSSITGIDEFTIQQKFMTYKGNPEKISQDDFVTLAYVIFRGGDNDMVYFYLQDKDYSGKVPKDLIINVMKQRRIENPEKLIERHCGAQKFVTAEVWTIMIDSAKS